MLTVHNEYETARKVAEGCGLARFGDGECNIAWLQRPAFDNYDALLAERLRSIAHSDHDGLLIGMPDIFSTAAKQRLCEPDFWRRFESLLCGKLDASRDYYSTFFSRPDVCARRDGVPITKSESAARVDPNYWKFATKIWDCRRICVVNFHPNLCRHPLFENALNVEFIETPRRNAWRRYDKILHRCTALRPELYILSIGPVGTVLAHDLHLEGRWAIDFGQACRIWSEGRGDDMEDYY